MTFICQSCSSTHLFMFIHPSNYINLSLHWYSSISPVHPHIHPFIHFIHLFVHLSIFPSVSPSILSFFCSSVYPFIHPLFVHRSIHWCSSIRPIHPYIHSSRCSSRCPSIRSSIYSSILPSSSVHPCISFILPFVHPFIHPSLYLFTCSSIHPSFIHPSILSIFHIFSDIDKWSSYIFYCAVCLIKTHPLSHKCANAHLK